MADSNHVFLSRILIILILVVGYLSYEVVRPFLVPIVWGVILAIVFYPLLRLMRGRIRSNSLAALITVAIAVLLILGPISYLAYLLVGEVGALVEYVRTQNIGGLHPLVFSLVERVLSYLGINAAELSRAVADNASALWKRIAGEIPRQAGALLTSTFDFLLMIVALFFLLRDGPQALKKGLAYVPLQTDRKERLKAQVQEIVVSSVYGGLFSAIAHGVVGAGAFAAVGIPSPLVLGVAVALSSLIPLVGSAVVWGPAVIYCIVIGKILKAIILAVIAAIVIPLIDNFLRPMLVGTRVRVPFVIVLFGILGGIEFFGLLGLVLGPLVLAVFISLLALYREIVQEAGRP